MSIRARLQLFDNRGGEDFDQMVDLEAVFFWGVRGLTVELGTEAQGGGTQGDEQAPAIQLTLDAEDFSNFLEEAGKQKR